MFECQKRVRIQDTCYCAVAPTDNRGVVESIYATPGTDNNDVPSDNDYNENNDCKTWKLKEDEVYSLRRIKRKWSMWRSFDFTERKRLIPQILRVMLCWRWERVSAR